MSERIISNRWWKSFTGRRELTTSSDRISLAVFAPDGRTGTNFLPDYLVLFHAIKPWRVCGVGIDDREGVSGKEKREEGSPVAGSQVRRDFDGITHIGRSTDVERKLCRRKTMGAGDCRCANGIDGEV